MPTPKLPYGWSGIRTWLLQLEDGDRRYVRTWIIKWISDTGELTPEARRTAHARAADPFRKRDDD